MTRAGIFIGVNQTGQLQRLQDAAEGAKRMHQWAVGQGMADGAQAQLITDENGKVTPDQIYDAIKAIIDGPGADQLIVYFAGHGVNINRSEYWLLSDAPVRTSAAVNVKGSVELARYCGIPYVVFISDACRVAPEGIQAQNVRGQDIFPNDGASDRAKPVDQFYACLLGRTAAEIKDPTAAAGGYEALYTAALLDAISGKDAGLLESGEDGLYVKPAPLRDYLERELPRRLVAMGRATEVSQSPDAIVLAHSNWISRLAPQRGSGPPPRPAPPSAPTPFGLTREMIRAAAAGSPADVAFDISSPAGAEMNATAVRVATPFGTDHHETGCGVKVQGAHIVDFLMLEGRAEQANADGTDLRVFPSGEPESILLEFEGGVGTVLPVIPGFLTALTFDASELVDVALEPSAGTVLWGEYRARATEIRTLRGMAAAASRHGQFRLEGPEAMAVARRMQYAKGVDPAIALYAAYAYHDLQQMDRLHEMAGYLHAGLGVRLFDVAMLARELRDENVDRGSGVLPFVPMLSQGWALLGANRVRLHPALDELRYRVQDSLWSLYDKPGVEMLRRSMQTREVR